MSREIARQWFIPGDGIDRHVISADIQRYLGNDATVRPGVGTGEHQGVQGFWIKAYRNLTSAMIADLRADSSRWRQEQRATGTREPYVGSSTYHASAAGRPDRRAGESPSVDGPYGNAPSRERLPAGGNRIPVSDRMDVDPPSGMDRRYGGQPDRGDPYGGRPSYPVDTRPGYPQEQPVYSRAPPSSASYAPDPRYAPSSGFASSNDGAPPGYVRPGNYYVPVSTYEPAPSMPSRSELPNYGNAYGQPGQPSSRDARDPRYGQPDYADPRYAYPSPAATITSVSARDRDPIASPPQPRFASLDHSHLEPC
ncbi:hypothetical protein EJ03DRAFT_120997 [Teratosphaeria nubilosa]|uniref:Uncharacterized protein n=1 Tax=Teratosphaeria nubilosa TaxID=161662 RepID=A0A6G1L6X2_9PEZI|nr:hypothetical protein EJ03DRAFT_120997 [Teratosphaeria nubilosa]